MIATGYQLCFGYLWLGGSLALPFERHKADTSEEALDSKGLSLHTPTVKTGDC